MRTYTMRTQLRKRYRLAINQPSLFAWAEQLASRQAPGLSSAARLIAKRFHVSASLASVIAEHAGFATEASNG